MHSSEDDCAKFINKIIVIGRPHGDVSHIDGHLLIGHSLCHWAAICNSKEIMKHLLDLGGDLSKMSIGLFDLVEPLIIEPLKEKVLSEIDPNSLRHTEKESVFQLIMTHLCEPIKFLTDLLNQRINIREKENNYEFTLGTNKHFIFWK